MLLIDASVWVAAVTPDDDFHGGSNELVKRSWSAVAALDLTLYEVANAVGARRRQPEAAAALSRRIMESCGPGGLVRIDASLVEAAASLAAEHGLTAYDAAYVAAARRDGMTLVSADVADLVSKGLAVTPDAALYP